MMSVHGLLTMSGASASKLGRRSRTGGLFANVEVNHETSPAPDGYLAPLLTGFGGETTVSPTAFGAAEEFASWPGRAQFAMGGRQR